MPAITLSFLARLAEKGNVHCSPAKPLPVLHECHDAQESWPAGNS